VSSARTPDTRTALRFFVTKTGGGDPFAELDVYSDIHSAGARPQRRKMSPEERQTINRLCQRILEEKGSDAFDKLVKELNRLLELTGEDTARSYPEAERD
jgi:hypothetical protein